LNLVLGFAPGLDCWSGILSRRRKSARVERTLLSSPLNLVWVLPLVWIAGPEFFQEEEQSQPVWDGHSCPSPLNLVWVLPLLWIAGPEFFQEEEQSQRRRTGVSAPHPSAPHHPAPGGNFVVLKWLCSNPMVWVR
jgi:hypothetical protein